MKKNKFYIAVCAFVIALSFMKSRNLVPSSNNIWSDNDEIDTSDIVNQDWNISEFDIRGTHFKLIEVVYTNDLEEMDYPSLSLIDKSIVIDNTKILSDHYFIKVIYQITNDSDKEKSHGMNHFKMNFYEDGVDQDLPKEFSSNSINIGNSSKKSYMLTNLQPNETKEITIGMILPKEDIEKYQLVLSYNPTGSEVPRNEANEMIMNENFRFILLDSFLKGDDAND